MPTHDTTNIPEWWRETTLGEVVKTNISSIGKDFEFDEILYLDTGSITENKIESLQEYILSDAPSRAKRLIKDQDIVYSTVRPNQKHFGFIENPQENLVVSTGFCVITTNEEKGVPKFLYYFLTQDFITNTLQQTAEHTTSTYPSIRPDHIEDLEIILPPITEQQAIADILSSFDAKIELLWGQNETLESTAQTIFHEWFGRYSVESPKELPEGWRVGRLSDISEITSWKRPWEISDKKIENFPIPLIGASKIMGYVRDYLFEGKTLVIGRVGTHGEIQKFNEKIYPSDNTLVIKSEYFVFVYLILKWIDYSKMNRWAVQPLITQTDLKNYPIILPNSDIFNTFKLATDAIFEKIENNNFQIQSLSKTRDELLPRLMSGEVRV